MTLRFTGNAVTVTNSVYAKMVMTRSVYFYEIINALQENL